MSMNDAYQKIWFLAEKQTIANVSIDYVSEFTKIVLKLLILIIQYKQQLS
jgi:hypothetical protein